MKIWVYLLSIVLIFSSLSCRKDPKITVPNATNYNLNLPPNFSQYLPPMNIPTDNPITVEGVELGRRLFYETKLSANNTQACASCHSPEYGFSDNTAFSKGIDGIDGKRNSMPLFNLGWMNKLFWDGRENTLELQAFFPVRDPIEMHNTWPQAINTLQNDPVYPLLFEKAFGTEKIDSFLVVKALAQFERTLISGNSPFDKYLRGEPTGWSEDDILQAYQGFALFMSEDKGDCFHCHGDPTNPLWTDNLFHNNGLDETFTDLGLGAFTGNPSHNGLFKTPSLRNLVFSGPYMHDGRFETLEQVVEHYSTGLKMSPTVDPLMKKANEGGMNLMPFEKALIVKFLISLSDSSFITNPDFQAP